MKSRSSFYLYFISLLLLLVPLASCGGGGEELLSKYKSGINETREQRLVSSYRKNFINMENGLPFYVIRLEAPLFIEKPDTISTISSGIIKLKFGDVLYPLKEESPVEGFFYVKTIHGESGWVSNESGISVDYSSDSNLYFFSDGRNNYFGDDYYQQRYVKSNGEVTNSDKIILVKNIVPMLLGNFETEGWFFPLDYDLALELSQFAVSVAENKKTLFYASTMYDKWRTNELVISMNLLADSYHKLKFYEDAVRIHTTLLRRHFWSSSDNTNIGGLNSVVKLEKIYLDMYNNEEKGSLKHNKLRNEIVDTILILGDTYNFYTIMDQKWHMTAAEWILDILRKEVDSEDFYSFCDILMAKTSSEGYADMIMVHKAIAMYKDGKQKEALKILTSIKPKHNFKSTLRINDWLSEKRIIPDSIVYQYNF